MMALGRTDRLWLIGGLLVIALVATGGWFLAISPKFTQADEIQTEADGASLQLIKLNKEVAALLALEKDRAKYLAELQTKQAALPTGNGMPAYVRQLQDSGNAVGVATGFTVGVPIAGSVDKSAEISISLTVNGTPEAISAFLIRLQNTQPRAVLVKSINLVLKSDKDDSSEDTTTANMTLSAFCLDTGKEITADSCHVSE